MLTIVKGWIDINLTITPITIPLLFSLLPDPNLAIRLATSTALLRIITKGLKEPEDKLQLVKVLALGQVIDALESKTSAEQVARGSNEDEGEESYREALGRLLNVLGLELSKLTEVVGLIRSFWHFGRLMILDRKAKNLRLRQMLHVCWSRFYPSCCDLCQINMMTRARQYFPCCRPSLQV